MHVIAKQQQQNQHAHIYRGYKFSMLFYIMSPLPLDTALKLSYWNVVGVDEYMWNMIA